MKTIKVKPIETIKIEFNDKEYICSFNMLGMAYMQEELGKLDMNISDISPARMTSLILYSGIKPNNPDITMEEAIALSVMIGPASYGDIIGAYNDAMYESMDKEAKTEIKKAMALIYKQMK